jgi:hypothetical protein
LIDRVTGVLNEIPLSFPARIKKFRRGPGLPMHGESKRLEGSKIPRSNLEIAARKVRRERGSGGGEERKKREREIGHPALAPNI